MSVRPEDLAAIRGRLLRNPRELSGRTDRAIERTLAGCLGTQPSRHIDGWYRSASPARYESIEAAATYLGAYGPRSIMRYQEALLWMLGHRSNHVELAIVDYGCGPGVCLAALTDIVAELAGLGCELGDLSYLGLDRAPAMLEVGTALLRNLEDEYGLRLRCRFEQADGHRGIAVGDILILANVLNEGEGIETAGPIVDDLLSLRMSELLWIEPATERASRQVCQTASTAREGWVHVGPCPSSGRACQRWTFREFPKRTYPYEMVCLGRWAPAARTCKYSMVWLSRSVGARELGPGDAVVVARYPSGQLATCMRGNAGATRGGPGEPWDVIRSDGSRRSLWES
jgi:hypothetical protein